jgi:hypothetical protein
MPSTTTAPHTTSSVSPDAYTKNAAYLQLQLSKQYPRLRTGEDGLQKQLAAYKSKKIQRARTKPDILFQTMIENLGKLSRLIYEDEKELQNSSGPPQRDTISTFVFEHTVDFHIVPAYKKSTIDLRDEDLNFILRPNLNDQDHNISSTSPQTEPQVSLFDRAEFKSDDKTWLVGYDIETQGFPDDAYFDVKKGHTVSIPSETVSHQWYFNFQGIRFGVVLLTSKRLDQNQFVSYLNHTIPEAVDYNAYKNMRLIFVYAYFSVYESGWLEVKFRADNSEFTFRNKQKLPIQVIMERNDEWYGYSPLREIPLQKPSATGRLGIARLYKIQLLFADAIKLQSGGLKSLGELIGIKKRELPLDTITRMASFLQTNPRTFNDYAITDSIIAAEAHLYIYHTQRRIVGVEEVQTRMPGYSVKYFSNLYRKEYPNPNLQTNSKSAAKKPKIDTYWKKYLGYIDGKMSLLGKAFIRFYYGGRNDVLSVGPREQSYYLDLHSAYLTSVIMLPDYDFSEATVLTGIAAENRANELYTESNYDNGLGPFQIIGVECSFVFKHEHTNDIDDGTSGKRITVTRPVKPIFPIRIDESAELPNARVDFDTDGIIYPRNGSSCIMWPEFWVAKKLGLLEDVKVFKLTEFAKVTDSDGKATNWLAEKVLALLIERKAAKDQNDDALVSFYKNFLNFFYGKTAQGVQKTASALKSHDLNQRISTSAMTCFPLAAYITAFCRSVVGELLQLNPCQGITTDGFITPVPRDQLITGELCNRVQERLKTGQNGGFGNKKFIGCDYTATQSLFLKTRGYMFIDENKPTEEDDRVFSPKSMLQKIAKMGAQLSNAEIDDPATAFLGYLQRGYSDKKYFVKLKKIRKEQETNKDSTPEKRNADDTAITMTFDMKHIPVNPELKYFSWRGIDYPFVSFETVPLETATDFHILRMLIARDYTEDLAIYADPDVPNTIFKLKDTKTEYDNMREHWANTGIDIDKAQDNPYTIVKDKFVFKLRIPPSSKPPTTEIVFKYKHDKERLTELLLRIRAVPRYLELEDYRELLRRYVEYKVGKSHAR